MPSPAAVAHGGSLRLPRGQGERFQPAPSALLVTGAQGAQDGLTVIAADGTPVHAVCGGTLTAVGDGALAISGDDGCRYVYEGVRGVSVGSGTGVEAGSIVATAGPGSQGFRLRVTKDDGVPVDPYELLLGAPDPNELGYRAEGTGVDVDPEADDRRLVGAEHPAPPKPVKKAAPKQEPVSPVAKPPEEPVVKPPEEAVAKPPEESVVKPAEEPVAQRPQQPPPRSEADDERRRHAAARLVARRPPPQRS